VPVGRLPHGGHAGEIDVAAFEPVSQHCLHVECSIAASSWKAVQASLATKLERGRQYVLSEVFPEPKTRRFEQWAVLWGHSTQIGYVGGAKIVTLKTLLQNIARDAIGMSHAGRVFPEKYPLLRTIQVTVKLLGGLKRIADEIGHEFLLPRAETDL
jgi:hypothetical protein